MTTIFFSFTLLIGIVSLGIYTRYSDLSVDSQNKVKGILLVGILMGMIILIVGFVFLPGLMASKHQIVSGITWYHWLD